MKGRINLRCQLPMIPAPHTEMEGMQTTGLEWLQHQILDPLSLRILFWTAGKWFYILQLYSEVSRTERHTAHQNLRGGEKQPYDSLTVMHKGKCKVTFEELLTDLPSSPVLENHKACYQGSNCGTTFVCVVYLDISRTPTVGRAIALHAKEQRQKIIFLRDCKL